MEPMVCIICPKRGLEQVSLVVTAVLSSTAYAFKTKANEVNPCSSELKHVLYMLTRITDKNN